MMGRRLHILAVPYPAQGHVGPLMKLSQQIAGQGIRVTFVTAECIHALVLASFQEKSGQNDIEMVAIPDGLEPGDDYKDRKKIKESMSSVMPQNLENLIKKINGACEDEKITCVIADATTSWAIEVAEKMGIKRAMFWPSSVRGFALGLHVPELIETGIIDSSALLKNEMIQVSPEISAINSAELMWSCPGDPIRQEALFKYVLGAINAVKISNWLLCNSFYELDPSACDLIPNLLPVGPLLSSHFLGKSAGNLCKEDLTCLSWLDKQPEKSVLYVAFGSIAILNQHQFDELALGLELTGQPFLWVVRSDLINGSTIRYPDQFFERAINRGKIVTWAPQEKVLAHPSIACFISHCCWNSTIESISFGVPFLCWPYFADQFHIRSYICDVLNVGLRLNAEENGIISRHEIKKKINELFSNSDIRANAFTLKEMAEKSVTEGGSSLKNFTTFIERLYKS